MYIYIDIYMYLCIYYILYISIYRRFDETANTHKFVVVGGFGQSWRASVMLLIAARRAALSCCAHISDAKRSRDNRGLGGI